MSDRPESAAAAELSREAGDLTSDIDPAQLERALKRLPFREREAFLMKTRDRLSYAEIGAVLGLSPEAAEARVVSALIELDVSLTRMARPWWRFS